MTLDSPTVLISGPPKIGKSVAALQAFGDKAFWICCERGALVPAIDPTLNPCGRVPDHVELLDVADPYREALAAVRGAIAGARAGKYAAIVIDTLSSFADREFSKIRNIERVAENYGRANKVLNDRVSQLVWEVMASGTIFVALCHESEPSLVEGRFRPGGPKLPGKLVETVPSLFSIVLRCGVELDDAGQKRRVFRCDPLDRQFVTGDRYAVCAPIEPMDLRSVLRRAVAKVRAQQAGATNGATAAVRP